MEKGLERKENLILFTDDIVENPKESKKLFLVLISESSKAIRYKMNKTVTCIFCTLAMNNRKLKFSPVQFGSVDRRPVD